MADIPEISLVPGDIKADFDDISGDGVVDIDDFIRILRGFSHDAASALRAVVDINEDGHVNVSDLSIVKAGFAQ